MRTGSVRAAIIAASVVLASTAMSGPTAAAPCGGMNNLYVHTFKVRMKALKSRYRVRQTAKLLVTVTRPGERDPAGAGVPWTSPVDEPAAGVDVAVALSVGDTYLWGTGITKADGKATVPVKILSFTPAGWATADGLASNTQLDSPCLIVQEIGYQTKGRLFKVTR